MLLLYYHVHGLWWNKFNMKLHLQFSYHKNQNGKWESFTQQFIWRSHTSEIHQLTLMGLLPPPSASWQGVKWGYRGRDHTVVKDISSRLVTAPVLLLFSMQSCVSQSDLVNLQIMDNTLENDETDSFSDGADVGCLSTASAGTWFIFSKVTLELRLSAS